tara:strand:+ start:6498 stop:7601 length:1104 start_codon:yes stop_codon:yes gene_type:complete
MKLKDTVENHLKGVENYIFEIQKIKDYEFNFTNVGLNKYGHNIRLGPSCFGLKIFYMLDLWDDLNPEDKNSWLEYINSFQQQNANFPDNSFVDSGLVKFYESQKFKDISTNSLKRIINLSSKYNFELSNTKLINAVNADTKQAIATLNDVGAKNNLLLENKFHTSKLRSDYLKDLDWSRPWSAGGKFASMCVYSVTQDFNYSDELYNFTSNLVDSETGAYFKQEPSDTREIINGAMKVISGLDWLDNKIHEPKKLIDFCLNNKPNAEGCDIVDYIFVLYKCFQQSKYKEKEIKKLFTEILNLFSELNFPNGGFSYFKNKSQTHYYGVNVADGVNAPDIHGTILITWALVMMYDFLDPSNDKYNVIKP